MSDFKDFNPGLHQGRVGKKTQNQGSKKQHPPETADLEQDFSASVDKTLEVPADKIMQVLSLQGQQALVGKLIPGSSKGRLSTDPYIRDFDALIETVLRQVEIDFPKLGEEAKQYLAHNTALTIDDRLDGVLRRY